MRNRALFKYSFIIVFFIFSGCGGVQTTYIPLQSRFYPPTKPAKEIPVVTGTFKGSYEELGIILVRKYPGSLEEEIVDEFRQEAMMRGADAVIKVRATKQAFFSLSPFFITFPFSGIEAKGVAIKFKPENTPGMRR